MSEYTFNPDRRQDAILLAAKIAFEGKESTVHCDGSHFGGSPHTDYVSEYKNGQFVQHHYWRSEFQDGKGWVFLGMAAPVATQTETTETEIATMDPEPRFTIHPATLGDVRSLGIQEDVAERPAGTQIDYYRVQVDQAAEWIDLAILPTGALLAWGGDPAFLEGASSPEEALEMFFAEDEGKETFFLEYQRWGTTQWVRVPLGGTWALTAAECDRATAPIQALFSDLRWRRVPAPRA